jgi:hypothetical protein
MSGEKEKRERVNNEKRGEQHRLEAAHAAHTSHSSGHAAARGTLLLRSVDNASFGGEEEL